MKKHHLFVSALSIFVFAASGSAWAQARFNRAGASFTPAKIVNVHEDGVRATCIIYPDRAGSYPDVERVADVLSAGAASDAGKSCSPACKVGQVCVDGSCEAININCPLPDENNKCP